MTSNWKKFFASLTQAAVFLLPLAGALVAIVKTKSLETSSAVIKAIVPYWETQILSGLEIIAETLAPYFLPAAVITLFCLMIGPQSFSRKLRALWQALWIFIIFCIAMFLLKIADPLKIPVWKDLAYLAFATIGKFQELLSFSSYFGLAAGVAFVYSAIIFIKDLSDALLSYFAGLLDRQAKTLLSEELKTALSLKLIKTAGDLVPFSPSVAVLVIIIFIIGAIPLYFALTAQGSVNLTLNILGAAIIFYGFVQVFGIIFIFITGLIYFLVIKLAGSPPSPPLPRFPIR